MSGKVPSQIDRSTRRQTKKHKETNKHAKKKANYQTEPTNFASATEPLNHKEYAAEQIKRKTNKQANKHRKKHKTNKPTN